LPENPLLPHRKLQALHALMLRCRELDRKQKAHGSAREALLAATSIHLLSGDLLSVSPKDLVAGQLAPETKKPGAGGSLVATAPLNPRLLLCAAAARGLQASGADGLVLAFAEAGSPEPGWQNAFEWAQQSQLPLLLACADGTGGRSHSSKARQPALEFSTMTKFAKRQKLPILTVDGEDAVAVYRVMQESVLRARLGGGPAVIWAVMTPLTAASPKLSRSSQPVTRLQKYMEARNIPFSR
jgi:TPP-dependent pyruvate/acetoin dehydrogenase alpha subunit